MVSTRLNYKMGDFFKLLKRSDLDAAQLMGLVRFVRTYEDLSEVERAACLLYLAGRLEQHAEQGGCLRLILPLQSWVEELAEGSENVVLKEEEALSRSA